MHSSRLGRPDPAANLFKADSASGCQFISVPRRMRDGCTQDITPLLAAGVWEGKQLPHADAGDRPIACLDRLQGSAVKDVIVAWLWGTRSPASGSCQPICNYKHRKHSTGFPALRDEAIADGMNDIVRVWV